MKEGWGDLIDGRLMYVEESWWCKLLVLCLLTGPDRVWCCSEEFRMANVPPSCNGGRPPVRDYYRERKQSTTAVHLPITNNKKKLISTQTTKDNFQANYEKIIEESW